MLLRQPWGKCVQILLGAAFLIADASLASASGVIDYGSATYSGTIASDDELNLFTLHLTTLTDVNIQTNSFATSDPGNGILGGFSPALTLFSADGTFLAFNNGGELGACGLRATDAASGYCLDAFISLTLESGDYLLALSEDPNLALGNYSDGFKFDGQGNFTAAQFGLGDATTPCWLFDNSQRSCNWSVVATVTPASPAVPEPATIGLAFCGLAGCLAYKRRVTAKEKKIKQDNATEEVCK